MTCSKFILSILVPPLAVLDRGCGVVLVVFILWLFGGVPGIAAALLINLLAGTPPSRYVSIPIPYANEKPKRDFIEEKRKRAIIRLSDGEAAQVIDDDGAFPGENDFDDQRKRGNRNAL
jgi:uncharacterized membrane protein YqaE (UPF0057 family)